MSKKVLVIIIAILLVILGAAGTYIFINSQNKVSNNTPADSTSPSSRPANVASTATPTATPGIEAQSDVELIKAALVAKHNWNANEIVVVLSKNNGQYAQGTVNSTTSELGGGIVFAAKVGGTWQIVFDGNGSILCSDLTNYPNFPTEYIPECYDPTTQKVVKR